MNHEQIIVRFGQLFAAASDSVDLSNLDLSAANIDVMEDLVRRLRNSEVHNFLNLENCKMGGRRMGMVAKQLARTSSLKNLNLGGSALGDAGAVALAGALITSGMDLNVLNLCGNAIGERGAKALASAFSAEDPKGFSLGLTKSLQHLNLSNNDLHDAGRVR